MSFRARVFLASVAAGFIPLTLFLLGVRHEVGQRLAAQFEDRAAGRARVIQADLATQSAVIGERLDALTEDLAADNRFRLALRGATDDRRYVLDYAETAMRRSGLAFLQIQDSTGRILSSGHYRNEYDRVDTVLAPELANAPAGMALVRALLPGAPALILARMDSLEIAGSALRLIGGGRIDRERLNRLLENADMSVALVVPGDTSAAIASDSVMTREFELPFVDALGGSTARDSTARIIVAQSLGPLAGLRRSLDLWFLVAALLTAGVALLAAGWISSRVTRPLQDLASKTARLDLDRLDVEFESEREDEVGALARLLDGLTRRLRVSSSRLREAERRATVGDLARQLNHDVKNGLVPIRNVFRHLAQLARESPDRLPGVLLERQPTVESAIAYLETLARNYARLTPALDRRPCDLNVAVEDAARDLSDTPADVLLDLHRPLPPVAGDPVVIRRILDNLLRNAVESLENGRGAVTVSTGNGGGPAGPVRLVVADSGRGMTPRELEQAFEDFYTTKPGGTGLGLPIVKRLVLDLNGSLRVETEPGAGTRFIIDLPVAG